MKKEDLVIGKCYHDTEDGDKYKLLGYRDDGSPILEPIKVHPMYILEDDGTLSLEMSAFLCDGLKEIDDE